MKKLLTSVVALTCALSMTASATVLEFKMNDTKLNVQIDQGITSQALDVAPFTVNDRTMVPVRVISESFGADVAWDEATQQVTITKGDKVIVLTIGKDVAVVNGQEVKLDVTAFTENGRTMVPVRFVSESLGYQVEYEELYENVLITDEPAAMTVGGVDVSRATYKMVYDDYSGYGYDASTVKEMTESTLAEIYVLSKGGQITDELRDTLIESLDYPSYSQYVNTLETTYVQLMKKNIIAGNFYNQLAQSDLVTSDDKDIEDYYQHSYVTAKHILIPVMDMETGELLSDDEAADAKKLAQDLYNRIKKGEDFDKLMNEYSKDSGLEYYPEGYTFTYGEMMAEFEEAAFNLEVGKVSQPVETLYGYHIIKREPLASITDDIIAVIDETRAQEMLDFLVQSAVSDVEIVKNDAVINSIVGE